MTPPPPAGEAPTAKSAAAKTAGEAAKTTGGASPAPGDATLAADAASLPASAASPAPPAAPPGSGEASTSAKAGVTSAGSSVTSGSSASTPGASSPSSPTGTLTLSAPDLTRLDAPALIEKLADPSLEVRRLATNELVDRVGKTPAAAAIESWMGESDAELNSIDRGQNPTAARTRTRIAHLLAVSTRCGFFDYRDGRVPEFPKLARQLDAIATALPDETRIHWEKMKASEIPESRITELLFDATELRSTARSEMTAHLRRAVVEAVAAAARTWMNLPARLDPTAAAVFGYPHAESISAEDITKIRASYLQPLPEAIRSLLICRDYTAQTPDAELAYSTRMALRDCLTLPGGFETATMIAVSNSQAGEHLADVSLGVPTPEAADFLIAQLKRTKFETRRAGDYLKHALLNLPAERLDDAAKLFAGMRQNQPLPQMLSLATAINDVARQRNEAMPASMIEWSQRVLLETLASNNDELTKPAIAAVRDLKLETKLAPLAKIAGDKFRDDALRLAALEAAANLPASHDLLVAAFADQSHTIRRKRAAELLVQSGDTATVLAALPQAPWEVAISISGALAKSDAGAIALLDAVEAGKAPARVLTNRAVAGSFFSRPQALQDRAKALAKDLPPEDARLDKVIAERAEAFRTEPRRVDALQHGAQLFQQNCAVCHRFRNAGGNVGPNLDGAGARGPQRLIEDILDPSRNVDPGFRQTVVEMTDGRTMVGTNLRESAESIALTDATGTELLIPKSLIKSRTTLNVSMMPPIFETQLSAADLNDLLRYLLPPR